MWGNEMVAVTTGNTEIRLRTNAKTYVWPPDSHSHRISCFPHIFALALTVTCKKKMTLTVLRYVTRTSMIISMLFFTISELNGNNKFVKFSTSCRCIIVTVVCMLYMNRVKISLPGITRRIFKQQFKLVHSPTKLPVFQMFPVRVCCWNVKFFVLFEALKGFEGCKCRILRNVWKTTFRCW